MPQLKIDEIPFQSIHALNSEKAIQFLHENGFKKGDGTAIGSFFESMAQLLTIYEMENKSIFDKWVPVATLPEKDSWVYACYEGVCPDAEYVSCANAFFDGKDFHIGNKFAEVSDRDKVTYWTSLPMYPKCYPKIK